MYSVSDVYKDIVLNNDTMIHFPEKNIYAQAIIFNTSFILSSSSFPSFIPHALKTQKFCKVKPIHRNHVFGMTVFYQFQITGNDKGLYATMRSGRIWLLKGEKRQKKTVKTTFLQKKWKKLAKSLVDTKNVSTFATAYEK